MKYLATKERRQDRIEFVYKYREDIKIFMNRDDYAFRKMSVRLSEWINSVVRNELGYSIGTATVDIWISIRKTYNNQVLF